MPSQVDHLVFVCADLESGMDQIEHLLGVRPVMGGRHAAWGTHNALVGLGNRQYLEIIAPDPEATVAGSACPESFSLSRGEAHLKTWAAALSGLDDACRRTAAIGVPLGAVSQGRRVCPDGTELHWELSDPACLVCEGVVPFLIDWGASPHPGDQVPASCRLVELQIGHPDVAHIEEVLQVLGFDGMVHQTDRPMLCALIDSPRGRVELR